MKFRMPDVAGTNRMLAMIAGADAEVKPQPSFDPASVTHLGVYVDREDKIVAVCEADLKAAVGLGCSLSMIPQAGMESMLESATLSDNARLNLYEVMNIFSGLFMDDHTPHLRLIEVVDSGFEERVPAGTEAKSYSLLLGRYGTGNIRFQSI